MNKNQQEPRVADIEIRFYLFREEQSIKVGLGWKEGVPAKLIADFIWAVSTGKLLPLTDQTILEKTKEEGEDGLGVAITNILRERARVHAEESNQDRKQNRGQPVVHPTRAFTI